MSIGITEPLTGRAKTILALVGIALVAGGGAFGGWWFTSTSYKTDILTMQNSHKDEAAKWERERLAIAVKAQQDTAEAYQRLKESQDENQQLTAYWSAKLRESKDVNDKLSGDVAAGHKRVYIAESALARVTDAVNQLATSGSVTASGMGNGTGIGLTGSAGLAILRIRDGIISDRAKVNYLQGYVRDVVKQCKR